MANIVQYLGDEMEHCIKNMILNYALGIQFDTQYNDDYNFTYKHRLYKYQRPI